MISFCRLSIGTGINCGPNRATQSVSVLELFLSSPPICLESVLRRDTGWKIRVRFLSSPQRPYRLWDPPSASYPMGTGGDFPGVKASMT
jgi:hypothetical protein